MFGHGLTKACFMKVFLALFTSILTIAQLHALRAGEQSREFLMSGTFSTGEEEIPVAAFLGQFRIYTLFIFFLNFAVWVMAWKQVCPEVAIAGCAVSFVDFILNWEIIQSLAVQPFEAKTASRLLYLFQFLSLLHLAAYGAVMAGLAGFF